MELRSGTTVEHMIRKGILVAMVAVFTGWYGLDGYGGGYAKGNLEEARSHWKLPEDASLAINNQINKASARDFAKGASLSELETKYGKPSWVDGSKVYYFGPALRIHMDTLGDLVISEPTIEASVKHTEKDIATQKLLTIILGILCVPLFIHYFRVVTYKAILTDEGIQLPGKPFVPFEAMKSMDASDFKKGLLDVTCELDGEDITLRFDNYKLKEFKPFVSEVFARKGWDNLFEKLSEEDE